MTERRFWFDQTGTVNGYDWRTEWTWPEETNWGVDPDGVPLEFLQGREDDVQ